VIPAFLLSRPGLLLGLAGGLIALGAWGGYRLGAGDAARAQTEALNAAVEARDRAIEDDSRVALSLAGLRDELAKHRGTIEAQMAAMPLSKEIRYVVDGKTVTCDVRDVSAYRRLHDAAVSRAAAPGVVP
jgi:hypothetical protein